jgi:hypothetical protein
MGVATIVSRRRRTFAVGVTRASSHAGPAPQRGWSADRAVLVRPSVRALPAIAGPPR